MKPTKFKEATIALRKPKNMTDEECGTLYAYQTPEGVNISCWTASFWQRIKFLFHGKIWLGIYSGKTQPPVWVNCIKTVFKKQ
jgi:hypothetical protein